MRISPEIRWILYGFHLLKSAGFDEIRRISKDQLPGMVSPMFTHFTGTWQSFCISLCLGAHNQSVNLIVHSTQETLLQTKFNLIW